jgi:hypothetical protein
MMLGFIAREIIFLMNWGLVVNWCLMMMIMS